MEAFQKRIRSKSQSATDNPNNYMSTVSTQNWKEVKIKDAARVVTGKTPPTARREFFGNEFPFITPTDIEDTRMFCTAERKLSGKGRDYQSALLLPLKSICFTSIASVGKICITDEPSFTNQQINSLIAKDEVADYRFLFYALKYYTPALKRIAGGTMTSIINKTQFENFTFSLPTLPEQKSIADVLFTLDNKIELLREQNKTLEATAQAIFKESFVKPSQNKKLPNGWRIGKLADEFEILMGQSPEGESYNESGEGTVFFQGRTDFGFRFPSTRLYTTNPKRMAEKFDVLVSVRAPVGDINMASDTCCIGRGVAAVKSKFKSYAYYKIKTLKRNFENFESSGTIFGSMNKDDFNGIEVSIPDKDSVIKFDNLAKPFDEKIYNNSVQLETLSKLRDVILPKLIRGEVRIENFSNKR